MRDSFKAMGTRRSRDLAEAGALALSERRGSPAAAHRVVVTKHGDAELGSLVLVLPASEECALALHA